MSDTIYRQAAIDALDEIRHTLWEIDIPSPTIPEYVEHHEQVQSVWKLLDKKQKELYVLPSAQPERKQVEIEYTAWNEELYGQSAICGNCGCTWQIGNNGEDNFCPNCGARMIRGGKDNDE